MLKGLKIFYIVAIVLAGFGLIFNVLTINATVDEFGGLLIPLYEAMGYSGEELEHVASAMMASFRASYLVSITLSAVLSGALFGLGIVSLSKGKRYIALGVCLIIFGGLTGIIGGILYFVYFSNKAKEDAMVAENPSDGSYNYEYSERKKYCRNCGQECKSSDEFCPNCGTRFE